MERAVNTNLGTGSHPSYDRSTRLVPLPRADFGMLWVSFLGVPVEVDDAEVLLRAHAVQHAVAQSKQHQHVKHVFAPWAPNVLFAHLIGAHG